jgi:hypothetical protein
MAKIRTKLNQRQVNDIVRELPAILSGRKPDKHNLHKIFWGAFAYSDGNSDDLGNKWDDLDQDYKAYKRPVHEGEIPSNLRRRLKPSNNRLGLLTPGEHKKWKQIFGIIYHSYKDELGDGEALALAGQVAWTRLKEEGAQTKRDVLGNRKVPIMQVTKKLITSLLPGKFDPGRGYKKKNGNQVFQLNRRNLKLGTELLYAEHHDDTRPIWPKNYDAWVEKAMEAGNNAVQARLFTLLR